MSFIENFNSLRTTLDNTDVYDVVIETYIDNLINSIGDAFKMVKLTNFLKLINNYDYIEIYERNYCIADGYPDFLIDNFALQGKEVVKISSTISGFIIYVREIK